jgi:hypothetical protein
MRNGSTLVGQLNGARLGQITFNVADIGEVKIDLREISTMRVRSANFEIQHERAGRFIGRIDSADQPGCIVISNAGDIAGLSLAHLIELRKIDSTLGDRLTGTVSLGYSAATQSDVKRLSINENIRYTGERSRYYQHLSLILTDGESESGIDRIDSGVAGLYRLGFDGLALQAFQYQKIPSIGVNSRILSLTSGGRRVVSTRFVDLDLLTGITFQKENTTNSTNDFQAELPLVMNLEIGIPSSHLSFSTFAVLLSQPFRLQSQSTR